MTDQTPCLSDITGLPTRIISDAARAYVERRPLLLVGEAGTGRTMIARRLTTILPTLTAEQLDTIRAIHLAAGLEPPEDRPYRAPHLSTSHPGIVGSFSENRWRPGEASLAYAGVLFLDEVSEFRTQSLQGLASSVTDGVITFVRAASQRRVPCRPAMVVGSAAADTDVAKLRERSGFNWLACKVPAREPRRLNNPSQRWPTSEDVRSNLMGLMAAGQGAQ